MIDALTKLKSFRAFEEHLPTCKHPKLFLIDIKAFKKINLNYGDEGGNFILCAFAQTLLNFAQKNTMEVFRAKNDQFILLVDIPFDLTLIEKIIFDLCDVFQSLAYQYHDTEIKVHCHIGISLDHGTPFAKATKALLVAKAENQFFVTFSAFANSLMEESEEKIEKMIQDAIENEQIVLHFQAVMDRNNTVAYYESLIRLNSHQGLQSPKLFLKIARDKNFYDLLLENIVKKITSITTNNSNKIALNLSSFDLLDKERVHFLQNSFANHNIIFEIQCEAKEHIENIIEACSLFKKSGIYIALDNIENAETIGHFKEMDVDFIKINGNIIRNLDIDEEKMLTCKAILEAAAHINAKTIATHINAKATLETAQKLPFDLFQGYIFEQPHTL